jgi:hypothetical protein
MFRKMLEQLEQDGITPVYFRTATEHEQVFRGVLKDVQARTGLAGTVKVDVPLEELLTQCYPRETYGRFVVADFLVGPREGSPTLGWVGGVALNESVIAYENVATLSGGGAIIKYAIAEDETVTLSSVVTQMLS